MPTINQLALLNPRGKKKHRRRSPDLRGCPQKRAQCLRVTVRKPKKPNSAQRKIARVQIAKTEKKVTIYIPGQGHNLQPHSWVLLRGGRVKDLPGIKYKAIRGKLDFALEQNLIRSSKRSKYSVKRPKKDEKNK